MFIILVIYLIYDINVTMGLKKHTIKKLVVSLLVIVFCYVFYSIYSENKIKDSLPEIPDFSGTEPYVKNYILKFNKKVFNNVNASNIGELGMVYHANNYFNEATKCYTLAASLDEKVWRWNYYLGVLNRELGNSEAAIGNFTNVLKKNAKATMAAYYLGEAYQQLDSLNKAKVLLQQLVTLKPDNNVGLKSIRKTNFSIRDYAALQLSKLYFNNQEITKAKTQLTNLISKNISFGPAYRQLSTIYAQEGNEKLKKYYSNRANDLNIYASPVDTLVDKLSFYSKTETYLLKQIDDAIRSSNSHWALQLINHGLKSIPNNKYILSKAIKQNIDMNNTKQALVYVNNHLKFFENNYKELIEVGVGLANKGYKSEAEKYFKVAENIKSTNVKAKATLAGMYFEKLNNKNKALEMMNTLCKNNPKNTDVLSAAIFLYLGVQDFDKAQAVFNKLNQINSLHTNINIFKGIFSKNNHNESKTVYYFKKALIENPSEINIISYLQKHYQKTENWKELQKLYELVLENNPNNSNFQEAYGALLLDCPDNTIQNLKKAQEYLERAFINVVYTMPTKIAAGKSLAIANFKLGNSEKAFYFIQTTISLAKKAKANANYIRHLESILNDFKALSSTKAN